MTTYRVVKPYTSYSLGFPLTLPVGTTLEWFEQAHGYVTSAVGGCCATVGKWAVETWREYFEPVKEATP